MDLRFFFKNNSKTRPDDDSNLARSLEREFSNLYPLLPGETSAQYKERRDSYVIEKIRRSS